MAGVKLKPAREAGDYWWARGGLAGAGISLVGPYNSLPREWIVHARMPPLHSKEPPSDGAVAEHLRRHLAAALEALGPEPQPPAPAKPPAPARLAWFAFAAAAIVGALWLPPSYAVASLALVFSAAYALAIAVRPVAARVTAAACGEAAPKKAAAPSPSWALADAIAPLLPPRMHQDIRRALTRPVDTAERRLAEEAVRAWSIVALTRRREEKQP